MADRPVERYGSLDAFLVGRPVGRYGVSGPCDKCGVWRTSLHRDHVIPKSKGGSDDSENLQYLCANCHQDKTIEDVRGAQRKPYFCRDNETRKNRIKAALSGRVLRPPQSDAEKDRRRVVMSARWKNRTPESKQKELERLAEIRLLRHTFDSRKTYRVERRVIVDRVVRDHDPSSYPSRQEQAVALRTSGLTLSEIGAVMRIGTGVAGYLVRRAARGEPPSGRRSKARHGG